MKTFWYLAIGLFLVLLGILGVKMGFRFKEDDSDYATVNGPQLFFIGGLCITVGVALILLAISPE